MRVALLSDTHGDPTAWARAMDALGEVDLICHSGDVLYHGIFNPIAPTYEPRRLASVLNDIQVPMIHARGNCDSEVDQLALDNFILSDFSFASIEGIRILITHGHKNTDSELALIARKAGVHLVLRGHTHVPQISTLDGITLFNPGSVALPKQEGEAPTAGLLEVETGKLTIFDLDRKVVFAEGSLPA
jgi:putative phosphoesterase